MTLIQSPSQTPAANFAELVEAILITRGMPMAAVSNEVLIDGWIRLDVQGVCTKWTIEAEQASSLFGKLPQVRLVSPVSLLAHVSHDRTICIDDGQGLSIAEDRPDDVLATVLCDAFEVLEKAEQDAANGHRELFDEFEGYWEGFINSQTTRSSVEIAGNSRLLYGHVEHLGKGKQICLYFTEQATAPPAEFRTAKLSSVSALYLRLNRAVAVPPPGGILNETFIQLLLNSLSGADAELWSEAFCKSKRGKKRFCPVLISMPRPSGGVSLFGISFTLSDGEVDATAPIKPLGIRRHTAEYMRERGGATQNLAKKHVAVIGCGSIGSEIADTLASCGVGNLTLVDFDEMGVENVFRHALGKDSIGEMKAEALSTELLRKYPGLNVKVSTTSGHHWLKQIDAERVDTIVVAIGAPASDRKLANQIRSRGLACTVTVTWLEAFGLGGHVISLPPSGHGCLDCVYHDEDGNPALHPYVSFLAPGQKVSRTISGCLGTFIPYSSMHSRRTALLATEAVMQQLNGNTSAKYDFWVGSDELANAALIETTAWFKRANSVGSKVATQSVFGHHCPTCGGLP